MQRRNRCVPSDPPRGLSLYVGGMDEAHFGVAFNDVDYCLKLREAGKRIVLTPHARLVHANQQAAAETLD